MKIRDVGEKHLCFNNCHVYIKLPLAFLCQYTQLGNICIFQATETYFWDYRQTHKVFVVIPAEDNT